MSVAHQSRSRVKLNTRTQEYTARERKVTSELYRIRAWLFLQATTYVHNYILFMFQK